MAELIGYLPPFLREVRDLAALMSAEQPETGAVWLAIRDVLNDSFVETATAKGIARYEKMLSISPKDGTSLDDRRFTILTRLVESIPFSKEHLHAQLTSLCGEGNYEVEILTGEYTLSVRVGLAARNNFDDVTDMLGRIVPANIVIDVTLKYNRHSDLTPFTHAQLAQYTHWQLRNEVFN